MRKARKTGKKIKIKKVVKKLGIVKKNDYRSK